MDIRLFKKYFVKPNTAPKSDNEVKKNGICAMDILYRTYLATKNSLENSDNDVKKNGICTMDILYRKYLAIKNSLENSDNEVKDDVKSKVHVTIGVFDFYCDSAILQKHSGLFAKFKKATRVHLLQRQVTPNGFGLVYDWMQRPTSTVQPENVVEVLNTASFLCVEALVKECLLCLENDDFYFTEDEAFSVYMELRKFPAYYTEHVMNILLNRVSKYFLTLVSSKEFLKLNTTELCTLLSSNNIAVNSEMEVFLSAVLWLSENGTRYGDAIYSIFKCIRFSLLPPRFLNSLKESSTKSHNEQIEWIVSHPVVKKFVTEGILYHSLVKNCTGHRSMLLTILRACNFWEDEPREWIFDIVCRYHRCPHGPKIVTYQSFLDYLEAIQNEDDDDNWRNLDPRS